MTTGEQYKGGKYYLPTELISSDINVDLRLQCPKVNSITPRATTKRVRGYYSYITLKCAGRKHYFLNNT